MASRCGCAGSCACVLTTNGTISLAGNGSTTSPWVIGVVPDCAGTMACVGSNVTTPVTYTGGKLGVKVSTDANQAMALGTDGGLYVQTGSAAGIAIADTATVDLSGTGAAATPLKANWLGATTDNSGNTGVTLAGNGTPINPLSATWSGVTTSVVNPEMTVTGKGTPASPMTIAWAGLPWIRFVLTNLVIANAATNVPVPWANDTGHGLAPFLLNASDNHLLTCQRTGSYVMILRLRGLLTAANTTSGGYFQITLNSGSITGPTVADFLVNTFGAAWIDLYASQIFAMTAGTNYAVNLNNYTGSNCSTGNVAISFLRISD